MDKAKRSDVLKELVGKKQAAIYLTDWQMRMVKDFTGQDCHVWIVTSDAAPHLRYAVDPGPRRVKRMYLTDWQMRELKADLGFICEFVELHPGIVAKYMVNPEEIRKSFESQPEKAFFRVELDSHQIKSLKETFGLECKVIDVPIDDSDLVRYKIPPDQAGSWPLRGLVLNKAQQKALRDQFGASCDFLFIDKGVRSLYSVDVAPSVDG